MVASDISSAERRRVPAGHAIAVVLLSLVMCAVLDADAVMASIEQQPFGTSRSVGLALARPVRALSDWTGLDLPRSWLDELLNGRPHHPKLPVAVGAPTGTQPGPAPGGPPPSTTATTVARRVPTAAQPLRVWMAGDSLMGTVSESFAALTKSNRDITVTNDVQIGTGLARPDVYDWPAVVSQEMANANPDVVVFMFGANDDQDMQSGGHRVVLGTDAWRQEYARRVNQMMALAATGHRQVIWLGVPAVKRPRLNHTKDVMNAAVITEAALYPAVTFVDAGPILDGPGASYVTYLTNAAGQPVKVRESDGVHFTLAGANRLTPMILTPIKQRWGLTS
jgi:uncharacterized protein